MNRPALHLDEAVSHLRRAKCALMAAAEAAHNDPDHSPTIDEMVGLIPRLGDLTVDVMGAARMAKECQSCAS